MKKKMISLPAMATLFVCVLPNHLPAQQITSAEKKRIHETE